MNKEQLATALADARDMLKKTQDRVNELEAMEPGEDRPSVDARHTLSYDDDKIYIDCWLGTGDSERARESAYQYYGFMPTIVFLTRIGSNTVFNSHPF